MEEHFRAEEAFIAYINVDHVAIEGLVHELLELVALHELPSGLVRLLVVVRVELLQHVFANVAVLLLNL